MSEVPTTLEQGPARLPAGSGALPVETLAGIAIFRGLGPDAVASLSRRCRWRRYGPGQTILQRLDESREVFFVVRGQVCVLHHSASGRQIRLYDLPTGEVFGVFAAIDGEPRSADVVSVTGTLISHICGDFDRPRASRGIDAAGVSFPTAPGAPRGQYSPRSVVAAVEQQQQQ